MFTIQYEAISGEQRMQTFDSTNRLRLVNHLAHFKRPIMAVYEQASPITKAMQIALAQRPKNKLSRAAQDFIASLDFANSRL